RAWRLLSVALTFHAVCLAWCFFRLTTLSDSLACVRKWFAFDGGRLFVGGSAEGSLWLLLGVYGALAWVVRRCGGLQALAGLGTRPVVAPLARGFAWGFGVALLLLALLLAP